MKRVTVAAMALSLLGAQLGFGQTLIKFATIAPKGTSPVKAMEHLDAKLKQDSGGRLGLRIYPGGVAGDELEVLRKIKMGQIHAAGFTGVGFGEILPEVRVLDLPFLFNTYEEVDHVSKALFPMFAQRFREKGFVLLAWAEVGFVHLYSKVPIKDPADMKPLKVWTWAGDPIAEQTFSALGVSPVALPVTDVLTSLQTGMIDTVYAQPLGCVALQWFTKVKTMTETPLTHSIGALLIQASEFDKLDKPMQELLTRETEAAMARLGETTRQENLEAMNQMKAAGVQIIPVEPASLAKFRAAADQAKEAMKGKVFSENTLQQVVQLLDDFRKTQGAPQP